MSFETDLQTWGKIEDYVIKLLNKKGWEAWKNTTNDLKMCDIFAKKDGVTHKIEVKTDMESLFTGNVALEQRAIALSSSHYFFYVIPKVYAVTMEQIGGFIKEYPMTRGGDFMDLITLVPMKDFAKKGKLL